MASPVRAAKNAPIPMPTRLLSTNCGVLRCAIRTSRSTTAEAMPTISEVFRSWVPIHVPVKASVGTAASTIPRLPPSALLICARTAASTVACAAGAVMSAVLIRSPERSRATGRA